MAFQRLYLKRTGYQECDPYGRFSDGYYFREERQDNIITKRRIYDTFTRIRFPNWTMCLLQEMEIDPEYASLIIPTMVICKNLLTYLTRNFCGCRASLWTESAMIWRKKKFIKSVHNFENDILVASPKYCKTLFQRKNHIQGTTNLALLHF